MKRKQQQTEATGSSPSRPNTRSKMAPSEQGTRPVRIMNISGSPVDRREALSVNAASDEPIDVFVGDWMSELNMPSRAYDVAKGLGIGYEPTWLEALEPALETIAAKGLKVAANAGCVATKELFDLTVKMVADKGLDLTVAWVEGDAVLDKIQALRAEGKKFTSVCTGEDLDNWNYEPLFAQCYLGGWGICEAFKAGADIVVCGRVADAAPIVAAAAWWHNWSRTDFDQLARALMAGHLIECSTYVTGGDYTGFKSLDWDGIGNMGYPIAEIAADGDVVITKREGTGGEVSVGTCTEQLLYEIQGRFYLNSDVTAVIEDAKMTLIGKDRVRMSGITGQPPPATTKCGLTAHGGYKMDYNWALVGLDIEEKAKMFELQLRQRMGDKLKLFTNFDVTVYGSVPDDPTSTNKCTCNMRLLAEAKDLSAFEPQNFGRPANDFVMASWPAATFIKRVDQPYAFQEYFPTVIPQPTVTVHFNKPSMSDISVPPPTVTIEHIWKQPSYECASPVDLSTFGETVKGPLGWVTLGRAGDKGSNCNVGFFVRDESEWPWLQSLLSSDKFKQLMGEDYTGQRIDRMEFPNLWAVHFLIHDYLDRGVTANATLDVLGKFICEFIRARHVDIPKAFLERGKV